MRPQWSDGRKLRKSVVSPRERQEPKEAATVLSEDEVESRRRSQRDEWFRGLEEQQSKAGEEGRRRVAAARAQLQEECSHLAEEQLREREAIVQRAEQLREDEIDEVKKMNQLVNYAIVATIRSQQMEERDWLQLAKEAEEEAQNRELERVRIESARQLAEREELRRKVLREGATLIRQQMAEREEQRQVAKARHDEEVKATVERIRELQNLERAEREERQRAQHALLEEISRINAAAVEAKKRARAQAQEEDAQIMAYLLQKDEREAEMEAQEAARRQQRETDLAQLRSMQQRATDTNAQMDELRAQKAAFQYEQECRRKEAEAAARLNRQRQELREERDRQRMAREHAISVEAHKLKEEFFAAVRHQEQLDAKVKEEEARAEELRKRYIAEVSGQIDAKEKLRERERVEFFREGDIIAEQQRQQIARLQSIRDRKLAELKSLGVPDIFMTELQKLTFA
ncbi:tumor suppressor, Mitostatin-domain-containing protein [Hyaloraphidium curvatum]|nr:tumor suppressor, Mitostatin-domain-containing protein [Hyaloraphidium curvatum]